MKRRVLKKFDLYSVRDAATFLDVSIGAVHDYARAGLLKALRASNASWLFTEQALQDFKRANEERKAAMARLSISNMAKAARRT